MRTLFLFCVALVATGSLATLRTGLRGVYAPPGWSPPPSKSGRATAALDLGGAIGNGPRVTIAARRLKARRSRATSALAPISDRPGYGTAIVNGHRSIIDLNNNRIVQVMD